MFPTFGVPNIRKFYLFSLFNSPFFMIGNWTFFFLKFMTYGEIGIFDAIAFAIGVVMEVPSGAIADMLGKRRTIIISRIMYVASMFITAFSGDKYLMFIGTILFSVGAAFYSGAAEAFVYDSMKEAGKEDQYDQFAGRLMFLQTVLTVIAAAVGGYLFSVDVRFPFAFAGVLFSVALLVSLTFTEPKVDSESFSWSGYLTQMKTGFRKLFAPEIVPFLPALLVLGVVYYMFDTGFVRLAMGQVFGFDGEDMSYITAGLSLAGAGAVYVFEHIRRKASDRIGLLVLLGILGISFAVSVAPLGVWGLVPLTLITLVGLLTAPWTSVIVNRHIESRYRATALSALALLVKLPYPLAAVASGWVMAEGLLGQFLLGTSVVVGIALVASMVSSSRHGHSVDA